MKSGSNQSIIYEHICLVVTFFTHYSILSHCQEYIVWRLATPPGLANAVCAVTRWAALLHPPLIPGAFLSSLSLDQLSSLPTFPFMFTVRVGADCCVYDLLYCCEGHIRLILCM